MHPTLHNSNMQVYNPLKIHMRIERLLTTPRLNSLHAKRICSTGLRQHRSAPDHATAPTHSPTAHVPHLPLRLLLQPTKSRLGYGPHPRTRHPVTHTAKGHQPEGPLIHSHTPYTLAVSAAEQDEESAADDASPPSSSADFINGTTA